MDPDSFYSGLLLFNSIILYPITPGVIYGLVSIFILLIGSALVSGSETAFFSLGPYHRNKLKEMNTTGSQKVLKLLWNPEKLLATILISNNFINIAIVVISTWVTTTIFDFREDPITAFLIQVISVTFLILLFGEIIPKLYANHYSLKFALFIASFISFLDSAFTPLSKFMLSTTSFFNRNILTPKTGISMVDLSDALDLTTGVVTEEKKILKSIVKFSQTEVNEIMRPRTDVISADLETAPGKLIEIINSSGYSRIPVYSETLDNIKGILYVKDILPHINSSADFNWQSMIRPPYYVPGGKKINILLQEFREKKNHLAIVVDEYGGTEGIITLEDILEEIVGDITDESDEIESYFTKVDERNYIFDAKVLLNDFYKALHVDEEAFERLRGDADTLAGLLLELIGDIPDLDDKVSIEGYSFTVTAVDNRRIKKIKVTLDNTQKLKAQ